VPALVGSALSAAPAEAVQKSRWTRFESIEQSGIPIVYARLNGSEGYRLALDFSVASVLLDEFLISGTGMELVNRGEIEEIDYYGAEEKVEVNYLDSLILGGVEKRGVKALIINGDDLGSGAGIPIYGRVGRNFLESLRLTVYYPRNLFLLEPSPEGDVPPGGVAFELNERAFEVDALVNGTHSVRFIVDPGASFTMIEKKWAIEHDLATKKSHRLDLASIQVGGFLGEKIPAILEEKKKLPYEGEIAGVIGASLLVELAMTYDFPRNLLWLRHPEGDGR
jgi:predicted aspartyl protease